MNERKLTKSELTKREDIIMNMKGNKRDLVKKYGADAEKVMYGRATNMAKKQSESMDQTNMKLKEMVKDALKNPKKADLNKDGKLSDYEETRGKAIEKSVSEDLDLGHEDNEPHMLKADLYRIGKYAMELYNIVDGFEGEGEVDFPAWWQAKITNAKTAIVGAKHYIDFEINEPKIDAVVDTIDDIAPDDDAVDTDILDVDIDEAQSITDGDTGFTPSLYTPNEMGDASVGGEYASGAFEESLKKTVAEKLAKKLKESFPEGIKTQIKDIEDSLESGESDGEPLTNETEMLLQQELKRLKSLKEGLPKGFWGKKMDAKELEENDDPFASFAPGRIARDLGDGEGNEEGMEDIEEADTDYVKRRKKEKDSDYPEAYKKDPNYSASRDKKKVGESYNTLVNKIEKSGKSEKAAKAIAGAVASYKAKGGGKGPTAKQK